MPFFKHIFNFCLFFTYKANILSRIKRAILFDKSKIALKINSIICVKRDEKIWILRTVYGKHLLCFCDFFNSVFEVVLIFEIFASD